MKLPNYRAAVEWTELFRIIEMRDGAVYKTESTNTHWPANRPAPQGHIKASLSSSVTRQPEVEITPSPLL